MAGECDVQHTELRTPETGLDSWAGCFMGKECSKCGLRKDGADFHRNASRADGRSSICAVCQREYGRQHYARNKRYYIDKARARERAIREWLTAYKTGVGCKSCGERHPGCLHFHHRDPSSKVFEICDAMLTRSIRRIEREIAKCDVLCANCHGKLHYELRAMASECAG